MRVLQILDELSRDGWITQRTLSKRLGVALGLTNLYLRRLIKKGYVKVVNIKPNRLRYELTPKGIAHKSFLTFKYIQNSYRFYREVWDRIEGAFRLLMEEGCRDVVFYGAGEVAEIAYQVLKGTPLRLAGVVDGKKAGERFLGRDVLPPDALREMAFDRLIITAVDVDKDTVARIEGLVGEERIYWLGGWP